MLSNLLRFVKTKGSSLSLPAHPSSRTLCVHYGAGGRAGAPASPAKRGERAIPFLAALFATCPPKPWRRREQKTEFGGGGKARGPAQQQAVCGINSAPSEAGNANFTNWLRGQGSNLDLRVQSPTRLPITPPRKLN